MKMTSSRALSLGLAAGVLLVALAVALFAHRDFARGPAYAGTPITPPKPVPDAVLVDGSGKPAHVLDHTAAVTFVFFGYTHCPDECPLALASLARAYRSLSADARKRTRIVFITVDPKNDTPPVLRRYVASFDPDIVGLTGPRDALAKVWSSYGVEVEPQQKELVGHGDTIYAIDGADRVVLIYPPDAKSADLAHDARALAS